MELLGKMGALRRTIGEESRIGEDLEGYGALRIPQCADLPQ
jgi:hypothetical protein